MPRVRPRVASLFALALGCACGTTRMTFAQAGFTAAEPEDEIPPRPPQVSAPVAPQAEEPFVVDGPEARKIDVALITFAARERALRANRENKSPFPPESAVAWEAVLSEVDGFLDLKPSRTPPLELMRAFVTLDAELGLDEQTYAAVPADVQEASVHRRERVRMRMVEVRHLIVRQGAVAMGWPIAPAYVTSLFGDRVDPIRGDWGTHQGVDLAAQQGQLVTAAGPGVVTRASWQGGHGLHVEVEHPNGLVTGYSHLSMVLAAPGANVQRGDPIGLAGTTGRSTGPHLHFEVWRNGHPVDPLTVLGDPASEDSAPTPPPPARSARRPPARKHSVSPPGS
jgi:murein DD-endopeptidase MepM/ murein hydrolase activator NlpD